MNLEIPMPTIQHPYSILQSDARTILALFPAQSIHCVVTSPPYYGLRDYNHAAQIGNEQTPEQYVAALMNVFDRLYDALRDDGTFWLNLGDSYGKQKQLLGIPWRVAFSLQSRGWLLRSEIVWHKVNAMPQSCKDRVSCNHETLFMFTKGPKYYFDAEAIKEPTTCDRKRGPAKHADTKSTNVNGGLARRDICETRNKRSVWTIPVACYREAHFATFPPKLVEPCILAGAPSYGVCQDCGAPWRRLVKRERVPTRPGTNSKVKSTTTAKTAGNRDPLRHVTRTKTVGWEPSCQCVARVRTSAIVLDPFAGAATTGLVALQHGHRFVGIELNPEYALLAQKRLSEARNADNN